MGGGNLFRLGRVWDRFLKFASMLLLMSFIHVSGDPLGGEGYDRSGGVCWFSMQASWFMICIS